MSGIESRQVSWWPVHQFITALTAQANNLPTAGTPRWLALADDDPRKLLALAAAGEHWVLRVETAQAAQADAATAISRAADWPAISRQIFRRQDTYIRRAS